MSSVILCNRLKPLQDTLKRMDGTIRYINLVTSPAGQRISSYLRSQPNATELPRPQVFRERSKEFRKNYIEFMGQVNAANSNLHWWAMSFTNKYSLATTFCRNVFNFILTAQLVRLDSTPLLVIADDRDLADQVKEWAKGGNIQAIDLIKSPWSSRRLLRQFTPVGLLRVIIRTFFLSRMGRRCRPDKSPEDEHLIIATHTHLSSFGSNGDYHDAYFGPLVDEVAKSPQKAIVLGLPYDEPFQQLRKVRTLRDSLPVVPVESCLTLKSLSACVFHAAARFIRPAKPKGLVAMDGLDLTLLLSRAIRESSRSGDLFWNLRVYYGAKWLAERVRVARCLYPYENRAWEKLLMTGMRDSCPQAQMVGYQHTSVTLSHTNFIFGPEEANITPLPDKILTTGDVTKKWLEQNGNYPPGIFKSACALRQSQPASFRARESRCEITKILVALATSLREYVDTLVFLEQAFGPDHSYELRVRPHPILSIESALEIAPLARQDFFSTSLGSLEDDLEWADVVLYASSTVGLQAVSLGIPAVHLDLGDFLNTDPMFDWKEFKWSVKEPSELVPSFKDIDSIPDAFFAELQRKAKDYAYDYLRPTAPSRLRIFSEV